MPVYPSGGTIAQSAGSPGFGPAPTPSFNASASVRFNPADTPNIGYVPTLQGSRTTFTFSAWVKRSLLGAAQTFFGQNTDTNNHGFFEFQANDALRISSNLAASQVIQLVTTQVFRDPSQWYNIVIVFDLTNATQADRVRLFVNGVRVTAFSTSTIPANTTTTTTFNASGVQHYIGRYAASSIQYFGGYLADMNFVDGLALTPSSFTATDANTGQLVPAQYTGNRGTNGFYLPFSGAALAVDLGQNPKTTAQDYPYWPYNTLLVDTTSTNGAQNNTFLDSSTNNFTITRNGNTTQGNLSPFTFGGGTTQANGYYSGYFDGTGDYLTVANNAALDPNTDSFCMECWVYITGTTGNNQGFNGKGVAGTSGYSFYITNALLLSFIWNGTGGATITGGTLSLNTWNHVAVVRNSGVIRLYLNGVGAASSTACTTDINSTNGLFIGQARGGNPILGYMSNYRMTKGTLPSGYDATATTLPVPTAPLTAITNTSLLTCQSSQFIDNSTNAFAITANGNSQPLPTNPFGMTAWSGYFDGTGDYLTAPYSASLDLTQGNFTVEAWVYRSVAGTVDGIICQRPSGSPSTTGWAFRINAANTLQFFYTSGSTVTSTATIPSGVWTYVAATRSGGTTYLFIDGQLTTSASFSNGTSAANTTLTVVGAENDFSGSMSGNISNLRVINGTALYTSNFTPPTAPLTAISGTQLLTCQSSTFVDNSPNAFPITVNGNSYTGTLNNPFNSPVNYTTPPVQAWSTYFDGSGDYLSVASNAALGVGSGDFTIECWIYLTQNFDATGQGVVTASYNTNFAVIGVNSGAGNKIDFYVANVALTSGTNYIGLNNWTHLAFVRSSGTTRIYFNGVQVASSGSLTGTGAAAALYVGTLSHTLSQEMTGYISNVRLVKGTAVYTANFTPPTAPLTAIPGTSLLTCQSNRFVDNSINNFTLSTFGNTAISPVSPFIPTQAWSAASYGGTMYFDGTGDYLTVANNAAFDLGSGNATIETWIYPTTSGQTCGIFDKRSVGTNYSQFPQVALVSGAFVAYVSYTGSSWAGTINGATPAVNTWTHVAFVRNGNTWTLYVNGAVSGTPFTAAGSVYASTDSLIIGASTTGGLNPFNGYISNARILKGTALYTTPFVPPVLPPTNISNTSLLLNATNAGIYDATGQNVIETVGNAQVSTAVKKFGESSISFDGSGDILLIPATERMAFGTGDFTVEAWVYPTATQTQYATMVSNVNNPNGWYMFFSTGNLVQFSNYATVAITSSSALSNNVWTHVAVSRVGTTIRMFFNGVQVASATNSTTYGVATALNYVGSNGLTNYFLGYLQDIRITKVGRYSGNFTPPAAAFAYNQYDIGNQQWLPTNISVTAGVNQDNLVDSPSDYGTDTGLGGQVRGNYCTMNPLNVNLTLSNGALDATIPGSTTANHQGMGTFGVSSGKWYFEVRFNSVGGSGTGTIILGVAKLGTVTTVNNTVNGQAWSYYGFNGQKYHTSGTAYGNTFAPGDTIGVALDMDNGKIWFSKNGVFQASGDPVAGTNAAFTNLTGQTVTPWVGDDSSSAPKTFTANFGQRAFSHTAPAGFKCLVSTNLPTVNGIGATSSTQATDYFNTVIWTGNGTNPRSITGIGFQPDMVWSKSRSQPYSHGLYDVVRGAGGNKRLYPNETYPENGIAGAEGTAYGSLISFDSDGFSVNAGTLNNIWFNSNNETYVAWNWKANGAGVANTAGTIPSTVSANTTNGVSILTYTGNGTTGATVGHGLGAVPGFIITKKRGATTGNWQCWHNTFSGIQYITLNAANPITTLSSVYNATPTSTVIQYGNDSDVNTNGSTYVAYCFAPINGFSAMGSYTGNGSTDGPFVYTNFRPEFVMIKCSSAGSTFWIIQDGARSPSNAAPQRLFPNAADAEVATSVGDIDILSNGFKIRNTSGSWNTNAATYIYIAFAEFPFKYSRAR